MKIAPRKPDLNVEDLAIVFVGDFNPKIFQPMWFASQGLLREAEAENAKVEIIHQDIASFSTDWVLIQVTRDRFSAMTKADAYQSHLSDLVRGALQKLSHTPVRQMGMNMGLRVRFHSEEDWHTFGHFLVPKSPWKGVLNKPGMKGLQIQQPRSDEQAGYVLVSIEPDARLNGQAVIRVNDHYEMPTSEVSQSAAQFVSIIEKSFEASMDRARAIAEGIVGNFLRVRTVDNGDVK
jgi:hypothetical protein